jgi:hypothetical protein
MHLTTFIEQTRERRPDTISLEDLADVHPKPWVVRHGSGGQTRILMSIGGKGLWYERDHGGTTWRRVDDASEFDILAYAA